MRHPRWAATAALLVACAGAHAEHFQYAVSLSGTYSMGGTDGCSPPDFDQPACPREGTLAAMLSFDTPSGLDGAYLIEDGFGDITNFKIDLGYLPQQSLFGGVNLLAGVPSGSVQSADGMELFTFDWATRSASFTYDYGYHMANGSFTGNLAAVPEPATALLMLAAAGALGALRRRRA